MGKRKLKNQKGKRTEPRAKRMSKPDTAEILLQVEELAQALCESEGLELIHVQFQPEQGGRTLRIYIDKPGGVTLDDCVNISRQLGDLLDVHLEDAGPYNLEISSPGPDRPLGKIDDYVRFKGELAHIRTSRAFKGQRNFRGILSGVADGQVTLIVDDKPVAIPLTAISKARLVDYGDY